MNKSSLLIATALLSASVAAQADELFVSIHSAGVMAQGAGLVPGVNPAKPAEVTAHLLKPGVGTLAF